MQRVNEGVADKEDDWREIGRWRDPDRERRNLLDESWEIDYQR